MFFSHGNTRKTRKTRKAEKKNFRVLPWLIVMKFMRSCTSVFRSVCLPGLKFMIASAKNHIGIFFVMSVLPSLAYCYDPSSDDLWDIGTVGRTSEAKQRDTAPPKQAPRTRQSSPAAKAHSVPSTQTRPQGDLVPAVSGLPPDPGLASTYRIGPKDLLRVEVFQVPELSSTERVNDSGQIVMSLIGPVSVGGDAMSRMSPVTRSST